MNIVRYETSSNLLLVIVIVINSLICAVLSLICLGKLIDPIDWVLVCLHLRLSLLMTFALFAYCAADDTDDAED